MTRDWVDPVLALKEIIGADNLINELINWLGKAEAEQFVEHVCGHHDISEQELENVG